MRWGWVPGLDLAVTQRFDSMTRIARVTTPLLILHGTADNVVPHTMADELYRQAGSQDKRLVKIEGGTHSGARGGSEGRAAILEFVRAPLPAATTGAAAATSTSPTEVTKRREFARSGPFACADAADHDRPCSARAIS